MNLIKLEADMQKSLITSFPGKYYIFFFIKKDKVHCWSVIKKTKHSLMHLGEGVNHGYYIKAAGCPREICLLNLRLPEREIREYCTQQNFRLKVSKLREDC